MRTHCHVPVHLTPGGRKILQCLLPTSRELGRSSCMRTWKWATRSTLHQRQAWRRLGSLLACENPTVISQRCVAMTSGVSLQEAPELRFSERKSGEEQTSLARSTTLRGVGLHSGEEAVVTLVPAGANEGRYFVSSGRGSTAGSSEDRIPACIGAVSETRLSTTLKSSGGRPWQVATVEHLLSALEGMGVDNVRIEMEGGSEMPILDGSAREWVLAIEEAGVVAASPASSTDKATSERSRLVLEHPLTVQDGDSWVAAFPSAVPLLSYGIDFPQVPVIGRQWCSWSPPGAGDPPSTSYMRNVAPARTFGIFEQFEMLRAQGLIKGGSLDNALVCSVTKGWLNSEPLRFPDEPCRHKLLDLVGDLALCAGGGRAGIPLAHVVAYK
eukprot:TRINITY_DN7409_c0_g1_i1.p1 TRINITY_DN7409_c0_g1~~TRINITY_DN7409_c0_g1_i1.p1  ORF type:complete len:409 (+),score=56.68 TRINITY_DN7409_c0_g1_i1:76-1227(+)